MTDNSQLLSSLFSLESKGFFFFLGVENYSMILKLLKWEGNHNRCVKHVQDALPAKEGIRTGDIFVEGKI